MRPAAGLAALLLALAGASAAAQGMRTASEAPQQTRNERYGNWAMSCALAATDEGKAVERCMVSQIVVADPRKRQVVLGLTVDFLDSARVPTLRARFSPEAEVRAGIGLKVDAQPDMRLPITSCDSRRCEAVGRLSAPVLDRLRSGRLAQFAYLHKGGKQIVLPLSLSGFDDALAALRKQARVAASHAPRALSGL